MNTRDWNMPYSEEPEPRDGGTAGEFSDGLTITAGVLNAGPLGLLPVLMFSFTSSATPDAGPKVITYIVTTESMRATAALVHAAIDSACRHAETGAGRG